MRNQRKRNQCASVGQHDEREIVRERYRGEMSDVTTGLMTAAELRAWAKERAAQLRDAEQRRHPVVIGEISTEPKRRGPTQRRLSRAAA